MNSLLVRINNEDIRHLIFFCLRPRDNCLTRQSNSTNSSQNFDAIPPLGSVYSPDEQCAVIYGFGSFYCSVSVLF